MTGTREPCPNYNYKQVLIRNHPTPKKYTSCKMSGEDYRAISPEWQEMRLKVLERDNLVCRKCGSSINVQVHHLKYPEVWGEEDINDLITLCDKCHAKTHGKE